jgi:hypothetical protein
VAASVVAFLGFRNEKALLEGEVLLLERGPAPGANEPEETEREQQGEYEAAEDGLAYEIPIDTGDARHRELHGHRQADR